MAEKINPEELKEQREQNEEDIEERKRKIKRDTRILIILLIILLFILAFTIGMGFALIKIYDDSTSRVPLEVVKSEILEVEYTEKDFFNLTDDRILSDEEGLKTKPLKFNLTNTGTSELRYDVKLVPLNDEFKTNEVIPASAIRYKIVEKGKDSGIRTFSEASDDSLYSGSIEAKESIDYDLYIWLDEKSNVNLYNKSYLFKIQIEAGK